MKMLNLVSWFCIWYSSFTESRSSTAYSNFTQTRPNTNSQWNQNLRLYPSLTDALSQKPHPLNVVNIPEHEKRRETIGFEHVNQLIAAQTSSSLVRSRTFDESLATNTFDNNENLHSKQLNNDQNKQRFKRRGTNRPSSPLPSTEYSSTLTTTPSTNSTSIIQRKKKRILIPQSSLNRSSSSTTSSQSIDDERQQSSSSIDERRRQREERQKEQIRLRRSQEIQRELDELEEKRLNLEKRYTTARQNLSKITFDFHSHLLTSMTIYFDSCIRQWSKEKGVLGKRIFMYRSRTYSLTTYGRRITNG